MTKMFFKGTVQGRQEQLARKKQHKILNKNMLNFYWPITFKTSIKRLNVNEI
jgi:hypothetical protein